MYFAPHASCVRGVVRRVAGNTYLPLRGAAAWAHWRMDHIVEPISNLDLRSERSMPDKGGRPLPVELFPGLLTVKAFLVEAFLP